MSVALCCSCFMLSFLYTVVGQWSASVLERVTAEGRAGEEGLNKLAFLVMGVMATLAALFKQGHRSALVLTLTLLFLPLMLLFFFLLW